MSTPTPVDDRPRSATPKGLRTQQAILDQAVEAAVRVGLGGLTIGELAAATGMSKSGLYAHVGSKEGLQVAVLDAAAESFARDVVVPALEAPRGEPRVRALVGLWLACGLRSHPGGCLVVKASAELDEQPGAVRDRLRAHHHELARAIARIFSGGVAEGHFRAEADPEQFAADLYGVMLVFYHSHRLLDDPRAEHRARVALDALLDAARPAHGEHDFGACPLSAAHPAPDARPVPDARPGGDR